jgi:hypothetical protein
MAAPAQDYEKLKPLVLEDLAYEWRCLNGSFRLLFSGASGDMFNAAFNDFLVHYRCLGHFFGFRRKDKDDVLAEHFIPGWTSPAMTSWGEAEGKLNKLLAHLTYARAEFRAAGINFDHNRDFPSMRADIEAAWRQFCKMLTDPSYRPSLDAALRKHGVSS